MAKCGLVQKLKPQSVIVIEEIIPTHTVIFRDHQSALTPEKNQKQGNKSRKPNQSKPNQRMGQIKGEIVLSATMLR